LMFSFCLNHLQCSRFCPMLDGYVYSSIARAVAIENGINRTRAMALRATLQHYIEREV
jgi:hypothetical protein